MSALEYIGITAIAAFIGYSIGCGVAIYFTRRVGNGIDDWMMDGDN